MCCLCSFSFLVVMSWTKIVSIFQTRIVVVVEVKGS